MTRTTQGTRKAPGTYKIEIIRARGNHKTAAVPTIDVTRGCVGCEMKRAGICYAVAGACMNLRDDRCVIRQILVPSVLRADLGAAAGNGATWARIGVTGDPSDAWDLTVQVCQIACDAGLIPVAMTHVHAHRDPTADQIADLVAAKAQLQIGFSGFASPEDTLRRADLVDRYTAADGVAVVRLISAVYPKGSDEDITQAQIVAWARGAGYLVLETPLRVKRTRAIWEIVDQGAYHRHLSPISGSLDTQFTAGLLFDGALPCASTCSRTARGPHDPGCKHQCATIL